METDGYEIPETLMWVEAPEWCNHPLAAREPTVEGGVGCANCGALLVPVADLKNFGSDERPAEAQVKYRLEGRVAGASLAGEWDDLEAACRCAEEISRTGGFAAVFKVTTEKV